MFSMCFELTPRAHIPDTRIPQLMQPWSVRTLMKSLYFWQTLFFRETTSIFRVKVVLPWRRLPWRWVACRRWSWRHLALKSLRRRPPAWRSSPLSSPWMGLCRRSRVSHFYTFFELSYTLVTTQLMGCRSSQKKIQRYRPKIDVQGKIFFCTF